jgi:sporulation protein YlmC with PRC-barrel domain
MAGYAVRAWRFERKRESVMRIQITIATVAMVVAGMLGNDAAAQARRRVQEPAPEAAASMPASGEAAEGSRVIRSSQVIGMQVWDPRNQQLGTIQDVVIDYGGSCPVAFFAVAPGISGIAEGYVVVPFDVIRLRYDNRSRRDYVVLDVSLDQFRNAPRLEGNNWDRIRDQQFLGRTRQFYQRVERSAARPISPGEAEKASPRDAVRPETRAPVDAGRRPNGYRRSDTERSPDKGTRSDTEEKSDKSSASAPRKNVGPSMERGGTGDNGKQEDSGSHDGRRQFNPR